MITVDRSNVHLKGSVPMLLTEITMACKTLKEIIIEDGIGEDKAKEHLQRSLNMAFMSQEELDRETVKVMVERIWKGLV